jgi:hypothetical protein
MPAGSLQTRGIFLLHVKTKRHEKRKNHVYGSKKLQPEPRIQIDRTPPQKQTCKPTTQCTATATNQKSTNGEHNLIISEET